MWAKRWRWPVLARRQHRPIIPNALRRAQCLLADPGGCELHDTTQAAFVGGHQEAGQCPLKRAAGLDGAQRLDSLDEGAALEYDAVGELKVSHLFSICLLICCPVLENSGTGAAVLTRPCTAMRNGPGAADE